MNRKINRLKLPGDLLKRLNDRKIITAKDLFSRGDLELVEMGFTLDEVAVMFTCACAAITRQPISSFDLLAARIGPNTLSLSDFIPSLRVQGVTEIVGGAGLGKTQACLMFAVMAIVPEEYGGLGGSVVYIDTESAFSATRLVEIAQAKYPEVYESEKACEELVSRVVVYRDHTSKALLDRLGNLQETIIEHNVKLVVVDSVASPVRIDFDNFHLPQRQELLGQIASTLKFVGETFNIPVVVTNQVTTKYGHSSLEPGKGSSIEAALGVTWAHAVTTRFILEQGPAGRTIKVAKSPSFPMASFFYQITASGYELLEEV